MNLPLFNQDGMLPPGDYPMTLSALRTSYLVTGQNTDSTTWDCEWRRFLVDHLETVVGQMWQVGIDRIFVDGSFVENKDHPNDIDGYFECDEYAFLSGAIAADLNAIDPDKIWTWNRSSRRPDPNSAKSQLPMWHRYRVEMWPHYGNLSGIKDRFGNDQTFPSAFRLSRREHKAKGIVQIVR